MLMPAGSPYGTDGMMVFADCAVGAGSDCCRTAQIAIATAKTARDIANIEPRVAMLSFSTKGSASHENVDKVVEATKLAKEIEPTLAIDGELQADAALVPSVGLSKAPGSNIAGHANVLVFPSLDVGKHAYKLVQRIGNRTGRGSHPARPCPPGQRLVERLQPRRHLQDHYHHVQPSHRHETKINPLKKTL